MNNRRTQSLALSSAVVAALSLACGQTSTPVAPSGAAVPSIEVGPNGETLKVPAPGLVAPANGTLIDTTGNVVLTVGRVAGAHSSFPITIEFDVRFGAITGTQVDNTKINQGSSGNTSITVTRSLEVNSTYSWRARATYAGALGPWSPTFTFRTPDVPAPYMRVNPTGVEIFDPLTGGRTVGTTVGSVQFLPGVGARMNTQDSHIRYILPQHLEQGEFSLMITGVDEGSPGDKSKVMSMQEGTGDITANDYRFTAELRGRSYVPAGAVTFRIITGGGEETIHDGVRTAVDFTDTRWYFWKFTWATGGATLQVRTDGPNGAVIYSSSVSTHRAYRPIPHVVYIGAPVGRGGSIDATLGGLVAKDLWFSARARPAFPAILAGPAGQ